MSENNSQQCCACGKLIDEAGAIINGGKVFCDTCRPPEDTTVMTSSGDGAEKTQEMQEATMPAERTMATDSGDKTMADDDRTVAISLPDADKTMAIAVEDGGLTVAIDADADKTVAIGGQPGDRTVAADRTQSPEKTQATATPAATGSSPQTSAQASRAQRSGTWASTLFTMNKSMAATRIIREVLKISPDVDLEHASRMYYARHGRQMSSDDAATIQDLIAGSNAESKYIFDKELGRGGMGAVFSTVDQDVRRKVAMKVMLPKTATSPAHIKRFLEEAQITGQLEHPNIVPVHEVGINEESNIYFTMKMVRGENLDDVLDWIAQGNVDYQQKYSLGVLLQIFMKVCDAVGYAHAKGVLHRDLKPENIMVGDFGEVLLMDWGLAKVLGREDVNTEGRQSADQTNIYQTMEGQVMGTPAYMSPEQAFGKISELDERSDIFSLGGILYKILTRQAPYRGKNAREALEKARKRQLQPPDLRAPELKIPPELVAVCMKAMARGQDERYGSAEELKDDIQRYLDGRSVSARRDSLFVIAKKWVIRNKVAAMGMAAAVVCLILGVMGAAAYQQKQKHATINQLLSQGDKLKAESKYEQAEETFFSVMGLDTSSARARQGISEVSGKALAMKNMRLAQDKVKEAEMLSAATPELEKHVAELQQKVERDKAKLKGYEGFDAKKALWDEERSLLAAHIARLKTEGRVISKYTEILSLHGENPAARAALAKMYYEKYREAEALKNSGDMAYYKELIFAFDDGTYSALLSRQGVLTITTVPAADAYFVYRFMEGPDRRMIPAPFSPSVYATAAQDGDSMMRGIDRGFRLDATGFVPIAKLLAGSEFNKLNGIAQQVLPKGSYLIVAQKAGFVETRIPVSIDNGENKAIENIKLLKEDDVPKGFVYIPRGDYISGGDPEAFSSPKRALKMIPGFLISKHEVTVGEYVKFLNFQESVRPGSAENYLPRKSADSGFYWKIGSQPVFAPDWPVLGIAQVDARLYCKWLTKAHNDRWEFRLPEQWEWEKAARGVDGRSFPWGNYFDFSFCSMGKSKEGRREGPDKVGSFPLDESVYGVHDMAGNVSEWTASFLGHDQAIALFKGAGWSKIEEKFARCAGYNGDIPEAVDDSRGFRIAISIKE